MLDNHNNALFPIFERNNNINQNDNNDFTIPTFPTISYNIRGLSTYIKGNARTGRRRKRILDNIVNLTYNNDLIHLQESKLLPNDILSLSIPILSAWGKFYSSKGEHSAGCITLVSPRIMRDYNITQPKLSDGLASHALALIYAPKIQNAHSFLTLNLYLYAGSDQNLKADMLKEVIKIEPMRYTFASGDFNLIDSRDDTSSDTDYHVMGPNLYDTWNRFLDHFKLTPTTTSLKNLAIHAQLD